MWNTSGSRFTCFNIIPVGIGLRIVYLGRKIHHIGTSYAVLALSGIEPIGSIKPW